MALYGGVGSRQKGGATMSLRYPEFESESQEADWLYDHRDLIEAEFLVAASEGRLTRQGRLGVEPAGSWTVAPDDLSAAKNVLHESGLWIEDHPQLKEQTGNARLRRAS